MRLYAFGLWTGAMLGFAFFFAPQAFAHVGPTPRFAATIAASIVALTRFGYVCAAVIVAASLLQLRKRPALAFCAVLAAIVCALGAYETHAVIPLMQHTALETPAYDALHRQSSGVYSVILLCGLIGFGLAGGLREPE